MDVLVLVLSGVLAAVLLMSGLMKLAQPREQLAADPWLAWVEEFSPGQVRLLGGFELVAAVALVLPWLMNALPGLTVVAALAVAVMQAGAARMHGRRGERQVVTINLALVALALVVAGTGLGRL